MVVANKIHKLGMCLLLIISLVIENKAQQAETDSLLNKLRTHTLNDTTKVKLLNKIAYAYISNRPDSTLIYGQLASRLADSLSYKNGQRVSYQIVALYHYHQFNNYEAIYMYKKAIAASKEIGNRKAEAGCNNNLGMVYQNIDKHVLSLEYFGESLKIYEELDDIQGISNCMSNIGLAYMRLGSYTLALEYFHNALVNLDPLNLPIYEANCKHNIGLVHFYLKDYKKALEYLELALKIKEETANKLQIAGCVNDIGLVYKETKNYEEALKRFEEALSIFEEADNKLRIADALTNIGLILRLQKNFIKSIEYNYRAMGLFTEVGNMSGIAEIYFQIACIKLEKKDYTKALENAIKSLKIVEEHGLLETQKNLHELLSDIYFAQGNHKKAYHYQIKHKELNDSIFSKINLSQVAGLEAQYKFEKEKLIYETEHKKRDLIRAEETKREKILRNVLIIGIFLMIIFSIVITISLIFNRKANVKLEEQKRTIEKDNLTLKELSSTKNKFFSIIAHDLRGPLGSLQNLGEYLWRTHDRTNPKDQKEFLRLIAKEAKSTFNLLDNLLNWANSNSETFMLNTTEFSIQKLVKENIELYANIADSKQITINTFVEAGLKVSADYNMINTVIRNLLANALKFTRQNGKIEISAKETSGEKVQICIADNGIGIKSKIRENLFSINSPHITAGTNQETGSGLGLKLCKEFVEKNKGTISVESTPGEGSVFCIELPVS